MSKTEKQLSLNLETKFTNLVLNPSIYKDKYSIDDQTMETLLSLNKWQQDLMIKSFTNGTKKIAIEQFPNMETALIVESLKSSIQEVQDQDILNSLVNQHAPIYLSDTDGKQTTITIGKNSKISLTINIDNEEPLKGGTDNITNFITLCKTIWILFLQFVEEKKLDLDEFIENCEKEISNFLDKNNPLAIKNNFDYEQHKQLGLSGSDDESAEALSFDDE
jgi:hypothetical protein